MATVLANSYYKCFICQLERKVIKKLGFLEADLIALSNKK